MLGTPVLVSTEMVQALEVPTPNGTHKVSVRRSGKRCQEFLVGVSVFSVRRGNALQARCVPFIPTPMTQGKTALAEYSVIVKRSKTLRQLLCSMLRGS